MVCPAESELSDQDQDLADTGENPKSAYSESSDSDMDLESDSDDPMPVDLLLPVPVQPDSLPTVDLTFQKCLEDWTRTLEDIFLGDNVYATKTLKEAEKALAVVLRAMDTIKPTISRECDWQNALHVGYL